MPPKAKGKATPRPSAASKAAQPPQLDPSSIKQGSESSSASPAPPHILDSPQGEIALFRALTRNRPVGPDKDSKMFTLVGVLNKALVNVEAVGGGPNGGVTADEIWDKLGRMFDLEKLDALNSPASPSLDSASSPVHNGRAKDGRSTRSPPSKRTAPSTGNGDPFGGEESDSSLSENEDEDEDAAGEDDEDEDAEGEENEEEPPTPKKRRKSRRQ